MYSKNSIPHEMYNLPNVVRNKRKELAKKLFIGDSQFQTVEKRILIGYRPQIFSVPTNLSAKSWNTGVVEWLGTTDNRQQTTDNGRV